MAELTLHLWLTDGVYSTPEMVLDVEPTPEVVLSVLQTLKNAIEYAHAGHVLA